MKSLMFAATAVIALSVNSAFAADPAAPAAQRGQVSVDVLSQVGLGGMNQVSDEQGLQVRGKGRHGFSLTANNNQVNVIAANPSGTSSPVINVQQNAKKGGNIAVINLGPISINRGIVVYPGGGS